MRQDISSLPGWLLHKLRALLFLGHKYKAVACIMESQKSRLGAAIETVNEAWLDICRQLPNSLERELRLLLSANEREKAIQQLSQQRNIDEADSAAFVDSLAESVQIHASFSQMRDLSDLYSQGKTLEAVSRVRANNEVGLAEAVAFLKSLQEMSNRSVTGYSKSDTPQMAPLFSLETMEVLPSCVEAQIEYDFPVDDRKGVSMILGKYGQDGAGEDVQLALLQLAKGDILELLRLVETADYRDVLYWASL